MAAPIEILKHKYQHRIILIEIDAGFPLPPDSVWVDRMAGLAATVKRTPCRSLSFREAYLRGILPSEWIRLHFPDEYQKMLNEVRKPFDYNTKERKHE